MMLIKLNKEMQKNETRQSTYTIKKKNSKWIKGLNVNFETIKLLEENIGSKISGISHSNIVANMSSRAREIKEK